VLKKARASRFVIAPPTGSASSSDQGCVAEAERATMEKDEKQRKAQDLV